jgi:hypothetical protein
MDGGSRQFSVFSYQMVRPAHHPILAAENQELKTEN